MKVGPATKLDKRNKTTSKNFDDGIMSASCHVIIIYQIFGQSGAIRKTDFGRMFCKTYIFIKSYLLSYKNWKQN